MKAMIIRALPACWGKLSYASGTGADLMGTGSRDLDIRDAAPSAI